MTYILTQLAFYGIPAAAILFFAVSLVRYCTAKKQNKRVPNSISAEELRSRRLMLIISSVIAGLLAAVVIAFTVLLFVAVAFM
ncbi:MAG: hypothetical protein IJF49_06560 [Clostridia bacterium]|nr:hypothetical protein [Clostridia bacterium]